MIQEWERSGELFHLPPVFASDSARRWLFCSQEIWQACHGPWTSEKEQKAWGHALGTLDAFITGRTIMVRFPPSKNRLALLALLEEETEDVWEFRCRDPKPQIRIFGRFAEADLFIALSWRFKSDCHTGEHYEEAKEQCKKRWRYFFPSYKPFRGEDINDYVSENCVLIRG
jgi:hypothetical protein